MKLDGVDILAGDLRVTRSKTATQQIIGFHRKTSDLVTTYIMHWRSESEYDELFLTEDGAPSHVIGWLRFSSIEVIRWESI